MDENNNLEILGQKFPTNVWTVAMIFVVGFTILGFHGLSLYYSAHGGAVTDFRGGPYVYQVNSKGVTGSARQRLLIFWTPSKYTKEDITNAGEPMEPWYDVDDKEEKILDFANKLTALKAQGFNRLEVWGKGTTSPKRGYLWRVTANVDNDNFDRETFAKFYASFWGRTKDIYLEEYDFSQLTR